MGVLEHASYINDSCVFTNSMYNGSAKLSACPSRKSGVPIDRSYVIGHHKVPGCSIKDSGVSCHTDSGKQWNWERHMRLVKH